MTPLELQLEGFTCYRRLARVRWGGAEAELFAVTGPTGAGKSTLLDAITYALYGQTPRLGARGLESLLTPGATTMHVQLTFRAARGVYRVTRAAQRRAGGVTTEVRVERAEDGAGAWRQLPESERVRDANRAIEEIVGLDYAGFTRAVLLPQGAFDEFLRGDAAERRRLLVALLGLDRVERVRELAGRLARDAEAQAGGLERRLEEDYADATAAAARELTDRRDELQAEASGLEERVTDLEARLVVARDHARVVGVLAALAARAAALEGAAAGVAAARRELEAGRRALALEPVRQAHEAAASRAERAAAEADAAAALAADKAAAATRAAAEHRAVAAAGDERRPRAERELDALQGLAPALATLQRVGGGAPGDADGAAAPRWLDEAEWARWQVAEGQLPELERATAAEAQARRRAERARREEADARAAAERAERELARRAEEGKALKEEAELRQAALQAATLADAVAAVRSHVHVGEHCPVCGNPVTALRGGGGDAALAAAAAAARDATDRLEAARADYAAHRSTLAAATERRDGAAAVAADAVVAVDAAATARLEAAARLAAQLGDLAPAEPAELTAALAGEALAAARAAAVAGHAAALRQALAAAGVLGAAQADPRGAVRALKDEIAALAEAANMASAAAERAAHEAERAADALAAKRLAAEEARVAADAAASAVAAATTAGGFADAAEARAALRDQRALEALAARVAEHERESEAVARGERDARAEQAALPPLVDAEGSGAPAAVTRLEAELAAARARQGEVAGELGSALHRLASVTERLERKGELRRELEAARAKHELHRQLALDLRGDRFQEYLMTQVQQRLARRASATLRLVTDGRFDLHLLDGDYLVADAWAGGELRSARTLSGGESFVASLALALALSDTLAGNASLGALFLDEGFGTLDRATLDSVTAVLEALTKEGRMVGVITHVPELSERLPARLVVSKGPDGSTVAWDA